MATVLFGEVFEQELTFHHDKHQVVPLRPPFGILNLSINQVKLLLEVLHLGFNLCLLSLK